MEPSEYIAKYLQTTSDASEEMIEDASKEMMIDFDVEFREAIDNLETQTVGAISKVIEEFNRKYITIVQSDEGEFHDLDIGWFIEILKDHRPDLYSAHIRFMCYDY